MGINMLSKKRFFVLSSITTCLLLSACGGGGSSGGSAPTIKQGVFKDSNVSGLSFVSGEQTGKTDLDGVFNYEAGKDVAFSLGGVELGSGAGKAVMTPLDLVPNAKVGNTEVINRVRFLMMLDKDNNPSNGIEISEKVQTKAADWGPVDFSKDDFLNEVSDIIVDASVEDDIAHNLPDKEDASTHLKTTLLCSYAGAYKGTYSGDESGRLALVVDPVTGGVMGSSYNTTDQISAEIESVNEIDYDNDLDFESAEDSAKLFAGKLDSTETMQGTWSNQSNEQQTGSFNAGRIGGASNAVYRYTVAYTGGDLGLMTFDINADNKVTGLIYSVIDDEESILSGKLTDNSLTVTTQNGSEINGLVEENTLLMTGVWANVSNLTAGNFNGGGCKLN